MEDKLMNKELSYTKLKKPPIKETKNLHVEASLKHGRGF